MAPPFSKIPQSYLVEWYNENRKIYYEEYGGERAGVPKGEAIPFPSHKIDAGLALLAYGAPSYLTLTEIARSVSVSGPLLRLWRTEDRFINLYRRAVWKCADDYVRLLSVSWIESRLAPYEEFRDCFGTALQESILRRLAIDVLGMDSKWTHLGLKPHAVAECQLVGPPPAPAAPEFIDEEKSLMQFNLLILFTMCLIERHVKDHDLAQWISNELMGKWIRIRNVDTELRAAVENHDYAAAIGHIDFVTRHAPNPLEDVKAIYQLFQKKKRVRRS